MHRWWRSVSASPALALAAVVSLGLGLGATTALFSVARGILLHPLPYPGADRLVILWNRSPGLGIAEDWFSTAQYFDIKTAHGGFDDLAIAIGSNMNLTGGAEPERVGVMRVSANLLAMFGATAARGRIFVAGDDAANRPVTAILSDALWRRRFGGDPALVGRTITLNDQPAEVIGILPATFSLPRDVLPTLGVAEDGEIFLPLRLPANAASVRTHEDYNIVGRLRSGVPVTAAQAEMDALTARLRHDFPDAYPPNGGLTFSIVPLTEQVVGQVRRPIWILIGAVCCVLLVAAANVANLLFARTLGRRRELAVRAALGATRGDLIRHLLSESLALAALGGLAGTFIAWTVLRWLQAQSSTGLPRVARPEIDGLAMLFALGASVIVGFALGAAAAWGARDQQPFAALGDESRGSSGAGALWSRRHRLRPALIVAEVAMSVMLLIGAGLLAQSLARLSAVPSGFTADGVMTLELTLTARKYANAEAVQRGYRALWESFATIPGVEAAGGVSSLPLSSFFAWGPITIEGRVPLAGEKFINADQRVAAGRYFQAMGIPLVKGRWFTEQDTLDQPRVVIVDEFMAREMWPGQDPIGRRLKLGDAAANLPWLTVVGVAGRVKQYGLDADDRIALYMPHTQASARSLFVTVKTRGDAAALAAAVRSRVHDADPDLPIYHLKTMDQRVTESMARPRFLTMLLTAFSILALVLAMVGVYGVMAYVVGQGTREFGIRLALGATPSRVIGFVLAQSVAVVAVGTIVGLIGAAGASRVIRGVLFGIEATDARTFVAVAAMLTLVGIVAAWGPARRAASVDPVTSMKA